VIRFAAGLMALALGANAQPALRQRIGEIAAEAHGKVSVACSLPGSKLNCDLNPHAHPPMQSVFKTPLALTVLHFVEQGRWTIDQAIRFRAEDRILPHTVSPLQDRYPNAEVDVPLRELLRLAVSESDNVAADVLLRVLGGPAAVERYIRSLGIRGFRLQDGEAALHRDHMLQYRDWMEPASAVRLLRMLADHPPCSVEHAAMILGWMRDTPRAPNRMKALLPAGTVMHKPGTSFIDNGLARACNDIGLIRMPDGRLLALAVFVTDATADEATLDSVIARIARAVYDSASF
jgi:beta-lactamase class A